MTVSAAYAVYAVAQAPSIGHSRWLATVGWGGYLIPTALTAVLCGRLFRRPPRAAEGAAPDLAPLLHCTSLLVGVASAHTLAWLLTVPAAVSPLVGTATVLPAMILPPTAAVLVVGRGLRGRVDKALLRAVVLTALVPGAAGIGLGTFTLLAKAGGTVLTSTAVAVATALVAVPALARALWLATEHVCRTLDTEFRYTTRPAPQHRSLLAAREGERHRLRRDLHDGLGPAIAGLLLRLDTAAARLTHEPTARGLVVDAVAETSRVLDEVRRIVDDLRPLDLDGVDLHRAIRQLAARLNGGGTAVVTDLPAARIRLPAATEVAAYRIVGECLTNALRHAAAKHVTVRLRVEAEQLVVEVLDDGVGLVPAGRPGDGVGLASIAHRAEEVGGLCTVLSHPHAPSGTLVRTVLPLSGP